MYTSAFATGMSREQLFVLGWRLLTAHEGNRVEGRGNAREKRNSLMKVLCLEGTMERTKNPLAPRTNCSCIMWVGGSVWVGPEGAV